MYIIHDIMNLKPNFVQGVNKIPNPPPLSVIQSDILVFKYKGAMISFRNL
jgi:hypothetical protein